MFRWHATYRWKALNKGYNFALHLTSIKGLHTKLWTSKVAGILILGILGLPLRGPGTKWHLGASPVVKHKEYYKGGGGGFPQVRVVVSLMRLMSSCLVMVRPCTKNYALTNLLFGLCKSMWIIELFDTFPSPHPRAPAPPSTPKALRTKERSQLLILLLFSNLDSQLSLSRSLRVHHG